MPTGTVCVTGVSGFVGSAVAAELLAHGYQVRGTVRDLERARREGLLADVEGAERLELVSADLLVPDSLNDAVAGCRWVAHVASPYRSHVEDPVRDLMEPAVEGTRSVLGAAAAAGVERVVLTSSTGAIGEPIDGHVFTEADWNTTSSVSWLPYFASKTAAERAAWDLAAEHGLDLVVINPGAILGPSLVPHLGESAEKITGSTDGTYPVVMDVHFPWVDVRDVAAAHRLAIEVSHANGRYLCVAEMWSHRRLCDHLRQIGVDGLPRFRLDGRIGTAINRLAVRTKPRGVRQMAEAYLGKRHDYDTTRIRTDLGLTFRPVADTVTDTVVDLRRWGHL